MQVAVKLTGTLQVGRGKPSPVYCCCTDPKPDKTGTELLISADTRHIWLNLDRESALALAHRLIQELS